ncbi:hypothetical protein I3760_15G044500 [Carya illinoinensis]|uniref:Homeobox-leucine zipper protein n=1 Tax=Carya illinoinensis TaxID=32201 RepID=A0A8T1N8T7_CARIL|nr:homeobox-leucine zipper protein ATHB-6-like [Carya illinoinensis]XP_042961609.1 homeobox-leucine zipper protein ATHB-6-like [Carya illinoinensis]KAG2666188.1 hypothetical protein I3760_15G044500 [Carya illinoinensis]KAG2666189.1 hypothetical protein I3760_15G044500 [Carya illinoinensis]KAG6626412.1 hypothetical protein CIPAW_15G046000 [Carya illinoinensis]KAG6674492.1 hypothetical protein I3842_15G044900 [Carya illinoinensis]KAG6674493.1 hypothetical protein I3842_15G044900 [Carya illinoin
MQQLDSSDSLGALISFCPPKEKNEQQNTHGYDAEFQAMLDRINQEDLGYETGLILEKRQRLSLKQVKELERNFEVENRLEPERKVKLAEELGLQPRQVAIWFQNRRTRWKTKQLQRDYGVLKASYDALKLDCDNLQQEKEALSSTLRELKEKLYRKSAESNHSVEEESLISEFNNNVSEQYKASDSHENKKNKASLGAHENSKDGSSGRVFNEVMKEENESNTMFSICFNGSSSSSNSMVDPFWFSESRAVADKTYQPQPVRMEEQSLFPIEESCNFFSVDQAPTLHWYFPEQ